MLDALLHDPDADDRYRSYVAAGPIEELLRGRPDDYAELIAARCAADPVWAWTVTNVWVGRQQWLALPAGLRSSCRRPSSRRSRGSRLSDRASVQASDPAEFFGQILDAQLSEPAGDMGAWLLDEDGVAVSTVTTSRTRPGGRSTRPIAGILCGGTANCSLQASRHSGRRLHAFP